jgi:hypothetical protein
VAREIHLELLIGRVVRDAAGRRIGRIEEMRAIRRAGAWHVTHFLLGPAGWRARLGLGGGARGRRSRVRWDALDLSDPARPRLIAAREVT